MNKQCRFTERLKYVDCYTCDGQNVECPHYLSQQTKSQQTEVNSFCSLNHRNSVGVENKTADTYLPMIIRNNELIIRKHSKLLDLIRRATDSGVIL